MNPYFIVEPKGEKVPVILSVPHSGVEFPEELKSQYRAEMTAQIDDTDWFVHDLYNFAPALGITVIHARYSRWVIDLNRDPESVPLYNDGRIITGLVPATDFLGRDIYVDKKFVPAREETERRSGKLLSSLLPENRKSFAEKNGRIRTGFAVGRAFDSPVCADD